MVRLFVGIFVPENLKSKIAGLQGEIAKLPLQCKFVEKENLHISLSFLGEIADEEIGPLKEKLDTVSRSYKKFGVRVSGLSLIPSRNYVRVMALEIRDGIINQISKHVEKEIGGDIKPPHLTLCRVKSISDKNLFLEKISEMDFDAGSFLVESVDLIKSELGSAGPVYSSLHKSYFA